MVRFFKKIHIFLFAFSIHTTCVLSSSSQSEIPDVMLSFDGGGIRGLISLRIIEKIESELKEPITNYVNCFAGTSTGAIIALGYSTGVTTQQLIDVYENSGRTVFASSIYQKLTSLGGLADEKYAATALENTMKSLYGESTLLSETKANAIVPSCNLTTKGPQVFSTFTAKQMPENSNLNVPVWFAARASSAAPTYFEPLCYQETQALADGGLIANNPSLTAFGEYIGQFGWNAGQNLKLISIGTGATEKGKTFEEAKDMGVVEWASPISMMMMHMTTSLTHQIMSKFFPNSHQYVRLNPTLKTDISLDATSAKEIHRMNKVAAAFIESNANLIQQAIRILKRS